jgi:hypothetical protein
VALPPISGSPTSPVQPVSNPRAAAQRAFFDAALKRNQASDASSGVAAPRVAAPSATTTATASAFAPVRTQQPLVQISDDPPTRPLRPGSMVNILV